MAGSLRQMAKKSFWNAYDHLGGCILLNLLWLLLSLPWLALMALLLTVGWAQIGSGRGLLGLMVAGTGIQQLMISPASAALWAVTAGWAYYRGGAVGDFFPALRKFVGRSLALWLCFSLAGLLLSLNVYFYQNLLGKIPLLGAFIAGLMAWIFVLLGLLQVYALAFLVQEDLSVSRTLRQSALVVLDNLWYSICLTLLIWAVVVAGLISVAGLMFIAAGIAGVVANTGLREILKKYQPPEDRGRPKTWAEMRETQKPSQEEPRGWRDLWKPWEG